MTSLGVVWEPNDRTVWDGCVAPAWIREERNISPVQPTYAYSVGIKDQPFIKCQFGKGLDHKGILNWMGEIFHHPASM